MGWFDSIKNAVGGAVNWVSSNSGSIASAAGTIARVAGLILVTEEEKQLMDDNMLGDEVADIQINYNMADRYLVQVAQEKTPRSALEAGGPDVNGRGTVSTQSATLSGVWIQPADLDQNGNPLVDVVQDISRFLHQHNIPTTIQLKRNAVDTAQLIGRAAFQGTSSSSISLDEGSDLVKTSTFSLEGDDDSCTITGCMAYYPIAMGQAQNSSQDITALHSALHVRSTTSQRFRRAQAMEHRSMSVNVDSSQYIINDSSSCGWLVTAQVAWTSILIAQQAWPMMKKTLATDKLQIVFNQQQGNLEVIKIMAASGVTPHQVKTELIAAVASALKALTMPPIYMNTGLNSATWTQLPIVEITNSALVRGNSSVNSTRNSETAKNAQADLLRTPARTQSVVRDTPRDSAMRTPFATRNHKHNRVLSKSDDWVDLDA